MAMAEKIYDRYNEPAVGKPEPKISEATLHDQLNEYDGPATSPDGWHVRMNKSASWRIRGPRLGECRQSSPG